MPRYKSVTNKKGQKKFFLSLGIFLFDYRIAQVSSAQLYCIMYSP